jgi:hypothetical protein
VADHHVDRPGVKAQQCVEPTGPNRSIGLISILLLKSERGRRQRLPLLILSRPRGSVSQHAAILLQAHAHSAQHKGPGFPVGRPGDHSEGPNTRSHSELGREIPLRQWYCVLRRGRVGRRQVFQPETPPNPLHNAAAQRLRQPQPPKTITAGWSSPVARQAHNLKVVGSNPAPATKTKAAQETLSGLLIRRCASISRDHRTCATTAMPRTTALPRSTTSATAATAAMPNT